MRKQLKSGRNIYFFLLLLGVFGTALAGCQTGLLRYDRGPISQVNRIELLEGEYTYGSWETRDLTAAYNYIRHGSELEISGGVDFADHIRYNFPIIDHFHLSAYLLDEQGNVLDREGLLTTGFATTDWAPSFKRTVSLPAGTVSMAFSYTGQARSVGGGGRRGALWGDDDGMVYNFWEVPY